MKNLKEFKTLTNLIKKYKLRIIISSIAVFLSSLSFILVGYLNGASIEAITNLDLKLAIILLTVYLLSEIFFGIIEKLAMTSLSKTENDISRKISFMTYQKALALPAYAYEEKSTGELINRITHDTETIVNSFDQLLDIVSRLISSFVILMYIFYNSYIVGLEIVLFIIVYSIVVKYFNPHLKKVHKERKKLNDNYTSYVTESIRGVREIKTLGIKKALFSNLQVLIKKMLNKSYEEINLYKNYDIISNVLKSLLEVGVFITCAILLYYEKTSLTFFVAMTYYVYRFTWIIENITSFTRIYNQVSVAITRINEILENKLYQDVSFGEKNIPKCQGVIKFENVSFNYPNEDKILNNFNIEFQPNKKIGIVGRSGQGKSTIFNLLTRVFDAKDGVVSIDNINIKDLSEDSLRKYVSIIRQEPFLFNRSIKDNFLLINKNLKLKNIRKYCEMAYIDDYIMSLPDKYDTILGEGGVNLSGGQKQRLSIARALAKESKIILFDEATSALDNESQDFIKKVIDDLVKDHTILIVAHRLSTIIDADIIYVIDKGKVAASGNHKELMKNSKIYQSLYKTENQ